MTRAWKIWYSDGSVFTSKGGTWEQAPSQDIQIVMVYYDKGRRIMVGDDYYFKDGDTFGQSFTDISKCSGSIKYGKLMDESKYNELVKTAMGDYSI